ncbi:hypothetical protein FRX31_028841 [Thalictrum thalictroides]|uniref:Uncharacterized protein n=1 Tax=Thalictrum thalictroides TaxID=46969 RepID=A0A7J6VAE0_THATH|nr:hypothetical protein FRX31_028841 [Thalictrum thalictroides]
MHHRHCNLLRKSSSRRQSPICIGYPQLTNPNHDHHPSFFSLGTKTRLSYLFPLGCSRAGNGFRLIRNPSSTIACSCNDNSVCFALSTIVKGAKHCSLALRSKRLSSKQKVRRIMHHIAIVGALEESTALFMLPSAKKRRISGWASFRMIERTETSKNLSPFTKGLPGPR